MTVTRDLFYDITLPVLKDDSESTSKLDSTKYEDAKLLNSTKQDSSDKDNNMQIGLYLPSSITPIIIRNTTTFTLGRSDQDRNVKPTIDLTKENALWLGVSRLHAKILYSDGQFYLKDLGSTNGTWLNQMRLEPYEIVPLNHHDVIRLGHLNITVL